MPFGSRTDPGRISPGVGQAKGSKKGFAQPNRMLLQGPATHLQLHRFWLYKKNKSAQEAVFRI